MKSKPNRFFCHAIIPATWLLALGTTANALIFDINSTTSGFGVADAGSYNWHGANLWNSLDAGTAATATWANGNTAAFFVGAGAGTNYTVRLGSGGSTATTFRDLALNVNVASNAALAGAAGNVTIGDTGDTGILTIGQNNSIGVQSGATLTINNSINMNAQSSIFRGGNIVINGLVSGLTTSRFTFSNGMGLTGGTLTLANTANTFAGRLATETIASGYTLEVTKLADGGSASSIGISSANIGLGGGTLKFIGTGAQSTNLGINMNGGTIDASGATSADTITISGAPNNAGLNTTLTLSGTNTGANTIAFDFSNLGSGTKALSKSGVGTWVLSGTNSYTGTTTISGGMLQLAKTASLYSGTTGSWTASNIRVNSGGTLALNVGGTDEFTTGNVTTLLTNLAASTSIGNGMNAGSNLGFDTTNASGGTFTIANNIANTTGASGGARGLTKLGTGTLTLSGASNSYTGATTIGQGTLSASNIVVSGGSSHLGNATSAVTLGAAGTQGTLSYTGNNATYTRGFTIGGAGGGRLDVTTSAQTLQVSTGAVTGTGLFTVGGAGNTTINANLTHTGGLSKADAGTLTLSSSGTYSYTGATTVSSGTLVVNGNISTSSLTTVNGTGILSGSGTLGAVTIAAAGTHNPGNSPGIVNTGDYTMAGSLNIEAIGSTPGVGGYDQVNVTGIVNLSGTLNTQFTGGTYANGNMLFFLLNNGTDAITGTFSGLAQDAIVTNYGGFDWKISYTADSAGNTFTGGNDVALMAIPEPSSVALLGTLGTMLLLRRRRA